MTGGLAYVYDADNDFAQKCNLGSVDLETVMPHSADEAELLQLIYEHYMATKSRRACDLLNLSLIHIYSSWLTVVSFS